jgi:adenosylcobinamide-phosphate synthase
MMVFAGLSAPMIAGLMLAGVVLDLLLGEVSRWHPLVGFGRYAYFLESRLNRSTDNFGAGAFAWCCAVLPFVVLATVAIVTLASHLPLLAYALHALLLYFCLGLRSLRDHCLPIAKALVAGDLVQARVLTSRIVTRDTTNASDTDVAKAAVESLLENGNDAVFGTLFCFVLAGGPGALLFRLANTLDAMWGYRTPRFHAFGCVAARIDDVLNWIPARLTALSYLSLGNARIGWQCWRTQAPAWPSPNAGPVMAAGAGALQLQLGGMARYDGVDEDRPPLGSGSEPNAQDILRAWRLVQCVTWLWCGIACVVAVFCWRNL